MRALADALPNLDEGVPPLPAQDDAPAFNPEAILKALNARRASKRPMVEAEPQDGPATQHGFARLNGPEPGSQSPAESSGQAQAAISPLTTKRAGNSSFGAKPSPSSASESLAKARDALTHARVRRGAPARSEVPPGDAQMPGAGPLSLREAIPSLDVPTPKLDVAAEIDAAVSKALEKAAEAREEAVAKARQEAEAEFEARLEAERCRWAEEIGQTLSEDLDKAMGEVHERISNGVSKALEPLMEEAFLKRALEQFSRRLDRLTGRNGSVKPVTVRGPKPLIDALRALRGKDPAGVCLIPSDDVELKASLGDTTISTTARTFVATLKEATGPRHETK